MGLHMRVKGCCIVFVGLGMKAGYSDTLDLELSKRGFEIVNNLGKSSWKLEPWKGLHRKHWDCSDILGLG